MRKEILIMICLMCTWGFTQAQSATCAAATLVTVDGATCATNQGVTDITFETAATNVNVCGSGANVTREAWYRFVATATTASVGWSSGRAPAIEVFSGGCGALVSIGCANNVLGSSIQTEVVDLVGLTIGATYYVRVMNTAANDITSGTANKGTLCITSQTFAMDCNTAHPVCNDLAFSGNSPGFQTQELVAANQGCLSSFEHQSTWFGFSPVLTGTIQLSITPTAGAVDYDFAIWGPYPSGTCPVTGNPLRCSYASTPVVTGLFTGAGDNTEGVGGDAHVNSIVIGAAQLGQVYYLLVDNYAANATPFTLDWTFSTPNMLDCTPPLPVQLATFNGMPIEKTNQLTWTTYSEHNNSHFIIQKSADGITYTELGRVTGSGNSNVDIQYDLLDPTPFPLTYYSIKQVDFDGETKTYPPITVTNNETNEFGVTGLYPNPADESFMIDIYSKEMKDAQVVIVNSMGQMVYNKVVTIDGLNKLEINSASWNPGIYIVEVINETNHYQHIQRVVIK